MPDVASSLFCLLKLLLLKLLLLKLLALTPANTLHHVCFHRSILRLCTFKTVLQLLSMHVLSMRMYF